MITLNNTSRMNHRGRKLSQQQVDHIRSNYSRKPDDMSDMQFFADWGALFGVSRHTVKAVINGYTWRTPSLNPPSDMPFMLTEHHCRVS